MNYKLEQYFSLISNQPALNNSRLFRASRKSTGSGQQGRELFWSGNWDLLTCTAPIKAGQLAQPWQWERAHTPLRRTPPPTPELSLTATPIDSRHPQPHLPACPRHSGPTILTLSHRHPGPAVLPHLTRLSPRPSSPPSYSRIPNSTALRFCSPLFSLLARSLGSHAAAAVAASEA